MAKPKKEENRKSGPNFKKWGVLTVVLVITFIAFAPALENGFVDWDDPKYLLDNPTVWAAKKENIKQIFFPDKLTQFLYVPLSQLSFALENEYSDHPVGSLEMAHVHHRNNLLLHILNTLLVFFLIFKLSNGKLPIAVIVSLFFGIHPMHVESVAWITERKDVLYTFFYLLSALSFLKFRDNTKSWWLYILSFLLGTCAMLSKSAAISLPAVLLLMVYWEIGKFTKKGILQTIPFFVLSGVFAVGTLMGGEATGTISSTATLSIVDRIFVGNYNIVMYLVKFIIPFGLTSYYPYPDLTADYLPPFFYFAPFIVIVLGYLVWRSRKNTRVVVFGSLFFLSTIALMLQFIPAGPNIMCERYTYVPYIGLLFMVGYAYQWTLTHQKKMLTYLMTVVLLAGAAIFTVQSRERTKVWENTDTLWTNVIEQYGNRVHVAFLNRGNYFAKDMGDLDRGIRDYMELVKIGAADVKVLTNLGNAYGLKGNQFLAQGNRDEGLKWLQKSYDSYSDAINMQPTYAQAYANRGITGSGLGRYETALADFNKALELEPGRVDAVAGRAYLNFSYKHYDLAVQNYTDLINNYPPQTGYFQNRAIAYFYLGQIQNALNDFNTVLQQNPNNGEMQNNVSVCYNKLGNYKAALEHARAAVNLGYNVGDAYINELKSKVQ